MIPQIAGQGNDVFQGALDLARATQSTASPDSEVSEPTEDVEDLVVKDDADKIFAENAWSVSVPNELG